MAQRTTLLLDDETRAAARELAKQYKCSVSEAIRRSVVRQRNAALGLPTPSRRERVRTLGQLYSLFEGNDPAAEIQRLKAEDEGF
jgi:hypothetical protein